MKKKLFTLMTLLLCLCSTAWAQTLVEADDMETTSGSGSSLTVSGFTKGDCDAISQSSEARTGSYSLKTTADNTSEKNAKTSNTSISVPNNSYLHSIAWTKLESSDNTSSSTSTQSRMRNYVGGSGNGTAVNTTTTWQQITSAKKAGSNQSSCYVQLGRKHASKKAILFDDVVIYVSANSTTDITAPTAASAASATESSISWTCGTDANTGIQNTLIFKRTSGSADDLTLNNQGKYAVNSTDQSGHWTLVSASVAADATSYAGTFTAGDVYAIVHRDLAYNYSDPAYVTVVLANDPASPTCELETESPVAATPSVASNLTVTASHYTGLQWYKATESNLSDAAPISGATNLTYSYTPTESESGATRYFYCVATNDNATGTKTAQSATLTVNVTKLTCSTPVITTSTTFNFANKGYPVTITNNEDGSTLYYSTNNVDWTEYTSTLYATATTHYYAKSTKANYEDSDVADLNVVNTYDPTKKYVAWVYTDNYKSSASGDYQYYHVTGSNANDPMFTALQSDYNMVPVSYGSNDTPSNDLNNANLIILSEAVAGSSTLTNGMKSFVGNVPMINFKFFAYTKASTNNRWGWGAPENPKEANATIKPNSLKYKVLKNITSNSDGSVTFYSNNSGNQIQGVTWNENPDNFPATNTDLATLNTIWGKSGTEESSKTVMHTSSKFFAIGLSCDSRQYYNQNAFTIVKNAAEMLMAGENLTAEETSASSTVQSYGWATYIPAYNVQFAEGDAYVVTEINTSTGATKVESVTEVPANTPVLLKGAGEKTITILNSVPAAPSTNLMTICNGANGNKVPYVLAKNGTSAGFKKWTGSINTINGRAVMWLDSAIATAREFFSLDDVTTGINAIDNELLTIDNNAPMYNLAGQKVGKSYKGIVIVNGKKVVRK